MRLNRLVVDWQGADIVGRAVSVLHFQGSDSSAPDVGAVKAAFTAAASALPNTVTVTVPGSGDVIEDTTGALVDVWTASGGGIVSGSATTAGPAGVGVCVGWLTGGIVAGRRLRGRTFIVPIPGNSYNVDGTLTTATTNVWTTWANAIIASGGFGVWHRPTSAGASDGNSYAVLSARIRPKVAFLSSRRD